MGTKFLELSEGTIAYEDAGQGHLVLCVPSMGDLRSEYRFLAPLLVSAGFRVISMDVRGHGETSPRWPDYSVGAIGSDMIALVRAINAGPALIIGASMAAGAGVWAAAEAPEWVAGLVLISPFVRGGNNWLGKILALAFARPWGPAAWLKYYASLYPTRKPADFEAYCAALRANLAASGRIEALQHMLRASKDASEQRLGAVRAPALVIMGSKDPDFKQPEVEARWVARSLSADYKMLPNAGHYPQAEMPEVTAPLVISFLQALETRKEAAHAA
jgi:pimeloyl-ACP methyl ester carboxylesterase